MRQSVNVSQPVALQNSKLLPFEYSCVAEPPVRCDVETVINSV